MSSAAGAQAVSHPFWVDAPGVVWLVERGAIDVFAVARKDGEVAGARHHLYRAAATQMVLGLDAAVAPDFGVLAVPLPDTQVTRMECAQLSAHAGDAAGRGALLALADEWISALTRGLARALPPRHVTVLGIDQVTTAGKDELVAPSKRMVWMQLERGRALFMGEPTLEIQPGSEVVPIPVRNDVWFQVVEDAAASTIEPDEVISSGRLWCSLDFYHRLALRYALRTQLRTLEAESVRLQEKAAHSRRTLHDALARIVRVTAGGAARAGVAGVADLLHGACRLIGERIGVEFRAPPKRNVRSTGEPVAELAAASNVRVRQVALKGEWWRGDSGPLLARFADSQHWVALLPARGGYALHDPESGAAARVDEALAERLNGFGFSFYPVLPAGPIGLARLLAFSLRGMGPDLRWAAALAVLIGLLGLAAPILSGKLVDAFIPSADKGDVLVAMLALIGAALAAALFGLARSIFLLRIEGRMDGAIHAAIWDRVLSLPLPFFSQYTAGDLALRLNGINVIRRALSGQTVSAILDSLFSALYLALLFYYSATLAVYALALYAAAVAVTLACGVAKLRYERRLSEINGRLAGMVFQYLFGIVKLRMAVAEARAFANWATEFSRMRRLAFAAQNVANVEQTFYRGYEVAVLAVLYAAIGMLLAKDPAAKLSAGDFVAFTAAFGACFTAILGLSKIGVGLLNLVPVYERAVPVLRAQPEVDESKIYPGELWGGLEVVKLSFGYVEGQDIFTELSFSVRPGGFIAVVGPSGSGKSTLFRLLLGFGRPAAGSIYYDNQALADLDIRAVRRQIGVVLQTSQLMPGNIFSNIVGSTLLTVDDAWEAARLCGLEDDIKAMPMGMHTVISEGSSTLSGGQRQRILIARAIVQRPRLLFFDEATSALDNRTQAIVTRNLEALKATRIVIAHRLSTVINADRILVLQDGRIVQNGSYATLMGQPGPFAELARRQLA